MDEIGRFVKHFVYRDAVFLVGGGSVLLSLLHFLDGVCVNPVSTGRTCVSWLASNDVGWHVLLFVAGVAYVIGYVVQDTCSPCWIVTTSRGLRKFRWPLPTLFRRFNHREWPRDEVLASKQFDELLPTVCPNDLNLSDRADRQRERIVSLRQIGTTIGPCWVLSSALLTMRYCWMQYYCGKAGSNVDLVVAVPCVLAGLLLVALGWLKTAQLIVYHCQLQQEFPKGHKEHAGD